MYQRILRRMRERIRQRQYVMTLHAEEEINEDGLSIYDVERIILSGEIQERQRDQATAESKYRIRGQSFHGDWAEAITKIGPTGKLVIITVYLLSE